MFLNIFSHNHYYNADEPNCNDFLERLEVLEVLEVLKVLEVLDFLQNDL